MNKLHISNNKAILTQEHATTWPYSRRSMQERGHTHAGACNSVATFTQEHANQSQLLTYLVTHRTETHIKWLHTLKIQHP